MSVTVVWSGSMLHVMSEYGFTKGELIQPRVQRRRVWWCAEPFDPDDDIRYPPMTRPVPCSSLVCAPPFSAR